MDFRLITNRVPRSWPMISNHASRRTSSRSGGRLGAAKSSQSHVRKLESYNSQFTLGQPLDEELKEGRLHARPCACRKITVVGALIGPLIFQCEDVDRDMDLDHCPDLGTRTRHQLNGFRSKINLPSRISVVDSRGLTASGNRSVLAAQGTSAESRYRLAFAAA